MGGSFHPYFREKKVTKYQYIKSALFQCFAQGHFVTWEGKAGMEPAIFRSEVNRLTAAPRSSPLTISAAYLASLVSSVIKHELWHPDSAGLRMNQDERKEDKRKGGRGEFSFWERSVSVDGWKRGSFPPHAPSLSELLLPHSDAVSHGSRKYRDTGWF